MGWVAFWTLLAAAFILTIFFPSGGHASVYDIAKDAVAAGSALVSSLQALSKINIRVYLWKQRARMLFHSSEPTLWVVALRLDNLAAENPIEHFQSALKQSLIRWSPQVLHSSPRKVSFVLDRTIHLQLGFTPCDESEDGVSHILIESFPIEVPYGQAENKLVDVIIPLLGALQRELPSEESSIHLRIEFMGKNPFFSFYIEHLKPDQVKSFSLVFQPDVSRVCDTDLVLVTQGQMEISAGSVDGFGRLTKAFVLLSSDAEKFTKDNHAKVLQDN